MSSKENLEEYVVFKVEEVTFNVEPFVQYETFGTDCHVILVTPRPIKVKKDAEGNYFYKGQLIQVIEDSDSISHTYYTDSNCMTTLASAKIGWGIKEKILGRKVFTDEHGNGSFVDSLFGFPVPLSEYRKNPGALATFKKFANKMRIKPIKLSYDPQVAKKQLKAIGIDLSEKPTQADNKKR